ncbi:cleft lip and palate transmembrane protein 1-like protein [Myripristis murdjan]|uniref:cleft lip and palate transmembrane protein 1-like protein n=1 Tax=Myripristis murdjan TaxID=586833 RepID=UPI001175E6B1|nr:cleft lip and palate transmembrane protein 1-like protein [Myripristis murdjan]
MFPSCYSKAGDSGGKRTSITKILVGVFVVYMLHTAWLLYGFLNTKPCDRGRGELCISSYLAARPRLQLSVFTCLVPEHSQLNLIMKIDPFDSHSTFERQVNVSLPEETRANGSLYAVVYIHKAGVSPLEDSREVHYAAQITTHITPRHTDMQKKRISGSQNPVAHWRPRLSITMMSEDFTFSKAGLPSDVRRYMRVSQEGRQMTYLPLLLVDELSFRVRDLMEISSSTLQLPLSVSYEGISLRRFRFWVHLQDVVYSLRQFGFSEENIDEIKETLVGSNLYVLILTALITALHLICEFLALKNDISSWRKKKSMVGMSRKLVLWRCLSTLLIFLHLLEETSLLVLVPVGLGASVEVWKVFKVFKIQVQWKSSKSLIHVNKLDEEERRTVEYDAQASRYLSYLVYPLCISGAIFSLAYLRYKSYYSWLINSLVSGVYAFGFLSMAPQLYINHKLKSVSHLQGTVLMYRGVNTLVSDLCSCASFFSSSGSFSSSHQLSCFRDELFFLLYLYQRRGYATRARRREPGSHSKKLKTQ